MCQKLLVDLERIKSQAISANLDIDAPPANSRIPTPRVVFVAWEEQRRLVLPWDRDHGAARFRAAVSEPEYARKVDAAEATPSDAVLIYRAALKGALNHHQKAHARFRLARSLERTGMNQEAERLYKDILALPSGVVDDQGMPFAFYAGERLRRTAPQEVAGRLAADLLSVEGLPPLQAYFLRGIYETLPPPHRGETGLLHRRIDILEQAVALQAEFASLHLTPTARASYSGAEHWLVGVSPPRPRDRRLVVAVRGADIFRVVEADFASARSGSVRISSETLASSAW